MGIQLKVIGFTGKEKIIDLCDNEEQLKKITVKQLKEKIIEELGLYPGIVMRGESFISLTQHVRYFLMN